MTKLTKQEKRDIAQLRKRICSIDDFKERLAFVESLKGRDRELMDKYSQNEIKNALRVFSGIIISLVAGIYVIGMNMETQASRPVNKEKAYHEALGSCSRIDDYAVSVSCSSEVTDIYIDSYR